MKIVEILSGQPAAPLTYLFHATLESNIPLISQHGLTPNTDREPNWDGYPVNGRLYVAQSEEGAVFYAESLSEMYDEQAVILRFPANLARTKSDPFGNPDDTYTTQGIAPQNLEMRRGDIWVRL